MQIDPKERQSGGMESVTRKEAVPCFFFCFPSGRSGKSNFALETETSQTNRLELTGSAVFQG